MKKCTSCGFECEDDVKFCTECGASFPEQPDFFVSPAPAPVAGSKQSYLKELSGSRLALILVVAFTLMLAGSIYSTTLIPGVISKYASEISTLITNYGGQYLEQLPEGLADSIDGLLSKDFSVGFGASAGQKLVPILTAIALWIVFISAKSGENPCCNASGFRIIRILKILGFVVLSVCFVAVEVILLMVAQAIKENGYADYAVIPMAILIVLAVIFLFVFFYYTGIIRTLKTLIRVSECKECKIRVSGYVAFIYFVSAFFSVVGAIACGVNANGESLLLVLAGVALLSGISDFAIGKYIRRCKKLKKI